MYVYDSHTRVWVCACSFYFWWETKRRHCVSCKWCALAVLILGDRCSWIISDQKWHEMKTYASHTSDNKVCLQWKWMNELWNAVATRILLLRRISFIETVWRLLICHLISINCCVSCKDCLVNVVLMCL